MSSEAERPASLDTPTLPQGHGSGRVGRQRTPGGGAGGLSGLPAQAHHGDRHRPEPGTGRRTSQYSAGKRTNGGHGSCGRPATPGSRLQLLRLPRRGPPATSGACPALRRPDRAPRSTGRPDRRSVRRARWHDPDIGDRGYGRHRQDGTRGHLGLADRGPVPGRTAVRGPARLRPGACAGVPGRRAARIPRRPRGPRRTASRMPSTPRSGCTAVCWPTSAPWWCWTTPATPTRSGRCCLVAGPASWSSPAVGV
jgi:hypothetical protein